MPAQVLNVGCKELLFWKLIYAVTCSVLSQVFLFIAFLFIMNISLLHPIIWIQETFSTLTSFRTWLLLIPLASIIFAQGIICSKEYVFESSYRTNRIQKCLGIISVRNLFMICLHIMTSGLMVWLYRTLLGPDYGSVCRNCDTDDEHCLNEEVFYLILNGLWIGLYYFVKRSLSDEKSILFPVIQQRKLLTIKSNIVRKLNQAMNEAVWPTLYFIVIYYYRGTIVRDWYIDNFKLTLANEPISLLDSSVLLIYAWLFSTLFIFTMLSMRLFFEVFLTEHWMFPIQCELSHVLTLNEALSMNNIPIIQHLACLDLYMLALWNPVRRQQLFTLSQPGGHPYNWNNVLQEVLKLVTDFSSEINRATETILAPAAAAAAESLTIVNIKEKSYTSPFSSPNGLRNMSLPRPEPVDIVNVTKNEFLSNTVDKIKSSIADKLKQIATSIRNRSAIQYLFGDMPESRIYFLLSKGQPIIWAIQGLSFIVTASFTEDSYGIVQKDLPVILTSLVNLKQNLDKLNKVSIVNRRSAHCELFKTQLKTALRSAVRRSLYNICNIFGEYLHTSQMQITKEVCQQLQTFVHYKEG
ncbi:Nuclear division cycle 1 [Carabus blaptoides fortunei]